MANRQSTCCQCYQIRREPCGQCGYPNHCHAKPCFVHRSPYPAHTKMHFCFRKVDNSTGQGLAGALFTLRPPQGKALTAVSDANGNTRLCIYPCLEYTLEETRPPNGYQLSTETYRIQADCCGQLTLNGLFNPYPVLADAPLPAGSFTARKRNLATGEALAGVEYSLSQNNTIIASTVSDASGAVVFANLAPGDYILTEATPPAGFQTAGPYGVTVTANGSVTINGLPAEGFILANVPLFFLEFLKLDATTGFPLADAVFQLTQNGTPLANATSTTDGVVAFGQLTPGTYLLQETSPPAGYLANTIPYHITISPTGQITVSGLDLADFNLTNTPFPQFQFLKTGSGLPVAGAVFALTQEGSLVGNATSTASGLVGFGPLAPGSYTLTETTPPPGFQPNPLTYTVSISAAGEITIDNTPSANFSIDNQLEIQESPPPTINTVRESDFIITGSGIPGAVITVIFPNGSTGTLTVGASGAWSLVVPSGTNLIAGQVISAQQTIPTMLPSPQVSTIVQSSAI